MKVAFIAPFYGSTAAGGAEAECRKTVQHLHRSGVEVEVFTTCLIDLQHDWNINAHPAGTFIEEGIRTHRFPAERTVKPVFSALNQKLVHNETLLLEEEKRFIALNINSNAMLQTLDKQKDRFDWICFIPYLFGTTYYGIQLCRNKSILIPCLHDEGYARMSIFQEMFNVTGRIVFHTESEQKLAHRLFNYDYTKDRLIGEGITTAFETNADRFRDKYNMEDPFILYAGRKHATKNTHTLVEYFRCFKEQNSSPLKLLLMGPGCVPIPAGSNDILDLGYLSEQDKRDAYSAATLFCQPSKNESFSIVLMEAWDCRTPTLVHGQCEVTREHAIKSGGGLWFSNQEEFNAVIDWFIAHPRQAACLGRAGQAYVRTNFTWDTITERFRTQVFHASNPHSERWKSKFPA